MPEDDPRSLGAYNPHKPVETFYQGCDAMVVGLALARQRDAEVRAEAAAPALPHRRRPSAEGRCYASDAFVCGDAALALAGLADRLEGKLKVDAGFAADLRRAHDTAVGSLVDGLGPYAALVQSLQAAVGRAFNCARRHRVQQHLWQPRAAPVRLACRRARAGGGIGQGLAMGISAAVGAAATASGKKTFCLAGDGGFILNLGELATAVQERADLVIVLMNDRGYGVIKNIQDAQYGGRRHYVDLHTPDYAQLAQSLALRHRRVGNPADAAAALEAATAEAGPFLLEIDMLAIGSFKTAFAGPPVNKATPADAQGEQEARAAERATVTA